jgi:hypothetical protein
MKPPPIPVDFAVPGKAGVRLSGNTTRTTTSSVPPSTATSESLTRSYASAALANRNEGEGIYSSGAHLAIAMRLALYGKASIAELREYLRREGVNATSGGITRALQDFRRHGYVSGDEGGFVAEESLVDAVRTRAPSRAHLESTARPLVI